MTSGVFQLNAVKDRDKESPAEEIGVTQGDCGRTQGCVGPVPSQEQMQVTGDRRHYSSPVSYQINKQTAMTSPGAGSTAPSLQRG